MTLTRTLSRAGLIAALLSAVPCIAAADFRVDSTPNPATAVHAVTQVGVGNAAVVGGFGTDVPLGSALKMLAPAGWSVSFDKSVADGTPVSWEGKQSWVQALDAVGVQHNLKFIVSWPDQKIYVAGAGNVEGVAQAYNAADTTWTVHSGSLYEQLKAWTDRANCQLAYNTDKNITLDTTATLSGSFEDAVRQLSLALKANGTPLYMKVYEVNCTLLVKSE